MPSIQITRFGGLRPSISERLLTADNAQVAHNTKLTDGTLRALCAPRKVKDSTGDPPGTIWQPQSVKECPCPDTRCWPGCVFPSLPFDCDGFGWAVVFGDGEPYRLNICTDERCPLCMPQPTTAPTATVISTGTTPVTNVPDYTGPDARQYVYTWVDKFGVESAPSPATCIEECLYDADAVVQLTGFDAPPAHACELRIYRTTSPITLEASTGSPFSASFELVTVLDPQSTSSFTDDVCAADLEHGAMITEDYCCAPEGLECVQLTDLGYLVGFIGNCLYISESQEYANWPDRNRFEVADTITGIAVSGDVIYVGTTGKPLRLLLARQNDQLTQEVSLAVDMREYDMVAPLRSWRNIVAGPGGAFLASTDGLYSLTPEGAANVSRARIEDCDWIDYYPHSLMLKNGQLFGSQWPTGRGWIMDVRSGTTGVPDYGDLVTADYGPLTQSHGGTGDHLISQDDGCVAVWDDSHEKLEYCWRSRLITSSGLLGFKAAKITADYGPPVQFRLYQDGVLVADVPVSDNEPFLLPLCGRGTRFEIELKGTTRVHGVKIATSVPELTESAPQ